MNDLSMHIMDIVYNSLRAQATVVNIEINYNSTSDNLAVTICDNGTGIEESMLETINDPFSTSRTTRKVGLGISLFELSVKQADGSLTIESEKHVYTRVKATMKKSHIDCLPLGDIGEMVYLLTINNEGCEIIVDISYDDVAFKYDSREIKATVGEAISSDINVINWIKDFVNENMKEIGY